MKLSDDEQRDILAFIARGGYTDLARLCAEVLEGKPKMIDDKGREVRFFASGSRTPILPHERARIDQALARAREESLRDHNCRVVIVRADHDPTNPRCVVCSRDASWVQHTFRSGDETLVRPICEDETW